MAKEFEMTGFKHVTSVGVQAFMCMMESEGSVAMLWDISNDRRASILMQMNEFDMIAYCKKLSVDERDFDNIMIELHEELVDARFSLEHAFIQGLKDVDCPVGNRTFRNLDCIKLSDEMITGYPQPERIVFKSMDELASYALEHVGKDFDAFTVCVNAEISADDSSDGQGPQTFEYRITGAGDHIVLEDIVKSFIEWGYTVTFTPVK